MVAQTDRLSIIKLLQKLLSSFILAAVFAFNAYAEPSVLVDDETHELLIHIVKPIFKTAGVTFDKNKIHILNDMSLNAFVTDGNHLFVHTGTLLKASNVNELSGILAHETGHISGGHVMRQKLKIQDLQMLSAISLIAAGSAAVASGRGDAAMAVALGAHGSMLNSLISYQLSEERAADESAVRYLKALHQSPAGLKNFMKTIQKNSRLSGYEEVPYFKTHPMNAERLAFFEKKEKQNGGVTSSPYDADFELVQAKLSAFLLPEKQVLKTYPLEKNTQASKYAHTIIFLRQKKYAKALALIDELISSNLKNPYFYQLKGEILFESGQIEKSVQAYQKALDIMPDADEIRLAYASCAMELPQNKKDLSKIIGLLNQSVLKNETPRAWELLAKAYYESNQKAQSLYASAKYSFLIGNIAVSRLQINEARKANPSKSLSLRLNDLENEIKQYQSDL